MMESQQPPKQAQGHCIFCGGTGMTKEHLFSDYLTRRNLILKVDTHKQDIQRYSDDGIQSVHPGKWRQGAMAQKKIRNVCRKCNGGWMSEVVNAAAGTVELMIKGEPFTLTNDDQTKLATWIALTSIMWEYTDVISQKISDKDRQYIYNQRVAPENWRIFVGAYMGIEWAPTRYRHHGRDEAYAVAGVPRCLLNYHPTQATTFVLSTLAVHAFSSGSQEVVADFDRSFPPRLMQQIWPICGSVSWPRTIVMTDSTLFYISDRLMVEQAGIQPIQNF